MTFDLVVLYADPLYKILDGEFQHRHKCFEHQEEYKIVTNAIKQTGRFFKIKRMNFSQKNINSLKSLKPQILHLSIHGHYDKNNKFHIALEKGVTGEEESLDPKNFIKKMRM